jgi:hypothetical protein
MSMHERIADAIDDLVMARTLYQISAGGVVATSPLMLIKLYERVEAARSHLADEIEMLSVSGDKGKTSE